MDVLCVMSFDLYVTSFDPMHIHVKREEADDVAGWNVHITPHWNECGCIIH
jgi:hypothetical protein